MNFQLHRADSPENAVALMAALGPQAMYLAGGTDLIIQMRRGLRQAAHVVDLSALDSMRTIRQSSGGLQLGSLCTHKCLEQSASVGLLFPSLASAATVVGGHQIRNLGTVGGNLANASPAADVGTVLLALDAQVHLLGEAGRRCIDIDDFYVSPGRTCLSAGELIEAVELPLPGPLAADAFIKVGRRKSMEISVVCVAVAVRLDASGRVAKVRIALGSVGPRPLRARAAEATLEGQHPSPALERVAANAAMSECAPRTDVRASDDYRRRLVGVLVSKALQQCRQRLQVAAGTT